MQTDWRCVLVGGGGKELLWENGTSVGTYPSRAPHVNLPHTHTHLVVIALACLPQHHEGSRAKRVTTTFEYEVVEVQ